MTIDEARLIFISITLTKTLNRYKWKSIGSLNVNDVYSENRLLPNDL